MHSGGTVPSAHRLTSDKVEVLAGCWRRGGRGRARRTTPRDAVPASPVDRSPQTAQSAEPQTQSPQSSLRTARARPHSAVRTPHVRRTSGRGSLRPSPRRRPSPARNRRRIQWMDWKLERKQRQTNTKQNNTQHSYQKVNNQHPTYVSLRITWGK